MVSNRTEESQDDSANGFQSSRGPMIQPVLVPRYRQLAIAPEAAIDPIPGTSTTGFNAHAGEVMASPRVFAIYWGRNYGSPTTGMNAIARNLDTFFSTILANAAYMGPLSQYAVSTATFLGSTWIDHDPGTAQTFNFNNMRDVLINWLHVGMLPVVPQQNELDLLFVIFAPTEVTLADDNGAVGGFCAYHWYGYYDKGPFGKYNLFFAVADATASTSVTSHELVEAFTDRNGHGWYSDDGGDEIGDVCSMCGSATLTVAGFAAASYWLVNRGRCLQQSDITPPPPLKQLRIIVSPPRPPKNVAVTLYVQSMDAQDGRAISGSVELSDPCQGITNFRTDTSITVTLCVTREFDPERKIWIRESPHLTVVPDDLTYGSSSASL
jgi:hypothetical protein